jgi:hypothetical protein
LAHATGALRWFIPQGPFYWTLALAQNLRDRQSVALLVWQSHSWFLSWFGGRLSIRTRSLSAGLWFQSSQHPWLTIW